MSTLRFPSVKQWVVNTFVVFPIYHLKGDRVRWRFVATEVNTMFREDNQSPGNAATDDSTSDHQSSRFVPHFRWNTQEDDSFLGCQEGVLQCGFERGNLCSPGDRTYARLDTVGG